MKTEVFGTNPYSKAKLFDYENYVTKNERSRPVKVMQLKKSRKKIHSEKFSGGKTTIPEKREEGIIKSVKIKKNRKRIPSVTQNETTIGGERHAHKPEEKRKKKTLLGENETPIHHRRENRSR